MNHKQITEWLQEMKADRFEKIDMYYKKIESQPTNQPSNARRRRQIGYKIEDIDKLNLLLDKSRTQQDWMENMHTKDILESWFAGITT